MNIGKFKAKLTIAICKKWLKDVEEFESTEQEVLEREWDRAVDEILFDLLPKIDDTLVEASIEKYLNDKIYEQTD